MGFFDWLRGKPKGPAVTASEASKENGFQTFQEKGSAPITPRMRPMIDMAAKLDKIEDIDLHVNQLLEKHNVLLEFIDRHDQHIGDKIDSLDDVLRTLQVLRVPTKTIDLTIRLREVLEVLKERGTTSPKEVALIFGIKHNTAAEYLGKLEELGYAVRTNHGVYRPTQ